jgi:Pregnancy-associated plasma protein-A
MANPTRRICAVMQHHEYLASVDATYRDNRRRIETLTRAARAAPRTNVIRIPVVVHVLHHTSAENISPEQIASQLVALNRDYRNRNDPALIPAPFRPLAHDSLIEFELAIRDPDGNPTTGITRTRTSQASFPYDPFDPQTTAKLDQLVKFDAHGHAAWPRDSYLNLWVCSLGNGLLGYAQFPGGPAATDGVVILNTAFGTVGTVAPPFNAGRTAVHEVGHWLNLLHIWGDDEGGCSGSDNVSDTPNQAEANTGTPEFPHVTCNNAPHGDMFMNYMDYVDDAAMFMFSKGQIRRMDATLSGSRLPITQSTGLIPLSEPAVAASARGTERESGEQPQRWFDGVSWIGQ